MKMIPNERIIAKPMTLYVQDVPLFYLPFAVLANKNGNRLYDFEPFLSELGTYSNEKKSISAEIMLKDDIFFLVAPKKRQIFHLWVWDECKKIENLDHLPPVLQKQLFL